jgi:hypothetical protein
MRIYLGELAVLVAFLFAPPLLLAFAVQARIAFAHGARRFGGFAVAIMATAIGSVLFGIAIHELTPDPLRPWLRVRDIGGFPIMPMAFLAVIFIAPIVTYIVLGRGHKSA